jgi:hypothetical protein
MGIVARTQNIRLVVTAVERVRHIFENKTKAKPKRETTKDTKFHEGKLLRAVFAS